MPGDEPNTWKPQPILLGRRSGKSFEVRAGLHAGDALAVEGAFVLKSALQSGELSEDHHH